MRNTSTVVLPARTAVVLAVLAAITACATRPAPEYGGRWKPVNRYAEIAQEIPLHQGYVFHPSPMDGTLKTMLERWARDAKQPLSYLHASDFTLHSGVAGIRTPSLEDAASQLSAAYAAQGIVVVIEGGQIVVRDATPGTTSSETANSP